MRRGKRGGYMPQWTSGVGRQTDSGWTDGYVHARVGVWMDCWMNGCMRGLTVDELTGRCIRR